MPKSSSDSSTPYSIGNVGLALAEALGQKGGVKNVRLYSTPLGYDGQSADGIEVKNATVLTFTVNGRRHWVPVTAVTALIAEADGQSFQLHIAGGMSLKR